MELRHLGMLGLLAAMLVSGGCQGDTPESGTTSAPHSTTLSAQTAPASAAPPVQSPQAASPDKRPDEFLAPVPLTRAPQEMTLVSLPVSVAPTIDGQADESFWATAPSLVTLDYSSQRPITLRSVYTHDSVFFLVTFPVVQPSETHKTWTWDPQEDIYREGPDREDVFIFKWSMVGNNVSLAVRDGEIHRADIWFWKAHRSNPSGYADDKWQSLSHEDGPESRLIPSPRHGEVYFRRSGDVGEPPFDEKFFFEYQGPQLEKYIPQQPLGSRGDVQAKGRWQAGEWTIEWARKLDTGHADDAVITPGETLLFGVSCYAIAYDTPHQAWSQPLYRTGDTFDRLFFTLAPRHE